MSLYTDQLATPQIESAVVDLERRIRAEHPEVIALYVKPQTPATFEAHRQKRLGGAPMKPEPGIDEPSAEMAS